MTSELKKWLKKFGLKKLIVVEKNKKQKHYNPIEVDKKFERKRKK